MVATKILSKKGVIVTLVTVILQLYPLLGYSQEKNTTPWNLSLGYSIYNQFTNGTISTSSNKYLLQGTVINPSIGIKYNLSAQSSILMRYEPGLIFSNSPLIEAPAIVDVLNSLQLNYRFQHKKFSYIFGITSIDYKFTNYTNQFFGIYQLTDHLGPQIGIAVPFNNGYQLEFSYDIVWDFIGGEFFFFSEWAKIRFTKDLSLEKPPNALSESERKSNRLGINIGFGIDFSYNHNRTYYKELAFLQKNIFGEIQLVDHKTDLLIFWKRSFWIDLEPLSTLGQSEFIVTNNLGIGYFVNDKNILKISYYTSNESNYNQIQYFRDSTFSDYIYPYRGGTVHFEHVITPQLLLVTQSDFILGSPIFENFLERVRPRVGLKIVL